MNISKSTFELGKGKIRSYDLTSKKFKALVSDFKELSTKM